MRLPQFTIRDLLWLMVVAAMAVAWWIDKARTQATLATYQAEMQELEATATRLSEERQMLSRQLWDATQPNATQPRGSVLPSVSK
jgi:hypothetical protein